MLGKHRQISKETFQYAWDAEYCIEKVNSERACSRLNVYPRIPLKWPTVWENCLYCGPHDETARDWILPRSGKRRDASLAMKYGFHLRAMKVTRLNTCLGIECRKLGISSFPLWKKVLRISWFIILQTENFENFIPTFFQVK